MANNKYTPAPRKYYKTNFVDLIELITPDVYQNEDLSLSGVELNPISQVINTHLLAANNISNVLSISGVANTQTSSLGNISGISQYFVKQNELTKISAQTLESKILLPLGTTFANYDSSSDFNTYLSGTLLPMIVPATGSEYGGPVHSNTTLSALTGNSDPSSIHNYLVDALGWFYFLNTSADGGLDYSPSSYVLSSFNTLYTGNTLQTVDGIKGFTEYIWKNYATCSLFSNLGLIPGPYVSGTADGITDVSAGNLPTYTSGTQRLENLQTLIDVIYSPLFIDQQDYTVKTAFQDYIDANTVLEDQVSKGPYRKFNNLVGFNFADISNQIDNIGLIYDIENAKDEHLQYIADLIGWKLRGIDPSKWRHQLRTAVDLYKKSGTMEAIQTALNTLVVDSVLDVSGNASELWESYLPFLIWYSLGTESPLFKDLSTWTAGLAQQSQVGSYSPSSLEENLKIVTDSILLEAYKAFPKIFKFHGEDFPVPRLFEINERGELGDLYTLVGDPLMRPFHAHIIDGPGYEYSKREAYKAGHAVAWDAAISNGPLGSGVYMAGLEHPNYFLEEVPQFLSATGDMEFVFNYRNRINYPMPPFEEIKYYKDSTLTPEFLEFIAEKLRCFQVKPSFVTNFQNYVLSAAITTDTSLGSLNEFLMFFSSVQVPPNFDDVMLKVSDHEKNILDLWNGKSSHLFIDFNTDDFDFAKDTLEGDGKYALYEASRIAKEFTPAHSITRVNLNAPAMDDYHDPSSTEFTYLGIDRDGNRASYTSASILGNFSYSGVSMGTVSPGDTDGRGGLNTFKRDDVDRITDALLSSTTAVAAHGVGRRALRRRNFRYLLPKEGYYDRTGFNGPVNYNLQPQNANFLPYTEDLGGSPGLDMGVAPTNGSSIDIEGTYWRGNKSKLGTFSSTLETNPFGGASSTDMSATQYTTGGQAAIYGANIPAKPKWKEKYYTIQSWYVKKPGTNPSPEFKINNYDQTAPVNSNSVTFEWDGNEAVVKTLHDTGTTAHVESVGNDWYRCSITSEGLGGGGDTVEGDNLIPYFYLIHDASDPVHLYISSPQLEQKLISNGDTLPSTYQAVAGEHPANQDRGELTLGYVPSAGQFYPIVDPINPSGVWHECETLESQKTFSGIATSATFPYRGVLPLGSNYFTDASTPAYVDRGQVPLIYNTMHELYEKKALDYANEQIKLDPSAFQAEMYWKNQLQSFANSAIASGLVLNSYDDYINFSFGTGLQKTYADYVKYFSNPLGLTEIDKTGGNIFAQVFGKGLYNCDFDIAGSAVSNLISPQTTNASSINTTSIWNTTADGTYIAQGSGRGVVPLSGTFIEGNPNNAEYRNPDILSGIEFTDISGAPGSNQFTIFKLDSSVATKGMENALVGNTVIKAKSLGGLPRLRFDLSSYGERPNKFIKDHYFKLKVKSLVAEENSPLLGGGQLGVWIHTQPNPRPNPNLLSMTENEILATIPDIWNKGSDIGTVSSVELTNPFGGASSLIMSGAPGAGNYAGVKALSSMPRMPKWDAQKTVAASFFVKKPASNAASGFMIDIVNADTTDPAYDDHTIQFNWDGTEPVCIAKSPSVMTSSIEDYGDGWYRVSTTVEGLVNTTEQQTGDAMHCHFFLGDTQYATDTIEFKTIHLWGFQLEQYYTDGNFDGPSPYEAVTGLLPDPLITNDYMWCWTPKNKWEFIKQEDISISKVLTSLTHRYDFDTYMGGQSSNEPTCLGNVLSQGDSVTNDNTLLNIQDSYFQTAEIDFNTRNYTEENNSEYLQVIPIPEDLYKINNQVHTDDTNYVVEIFFIPNNNPDKYLLIDSIELYDVTQADNAALPTGHGIETSGIPLKKFVKEDKLYLNKNQLREVLRFYNGLIGQGTGVYATDLASRDATITSGIMEVSGGSRLNYRLSPSWGATNVLNTQPNYNNVSSLELDN